MGFLDSVNDNDTNIPTRAEYLDMQSDFGFTAKILSAKLHKSQNKKNPKVYGREFFLVEMEFVSGDAQTANGPARAGDVLTFSKILPINGEALNAGYVLGEMADNLSGMSARPRSEFRGTASQTSEKIMEVLASGECIDKTCYVSSSAPNEKGYRQPVFEVVEVATGKSAKKAS